MHEPIWFTFLRNFPAWIVLAPMVIFFTILYKTTGDPAYKDWISWFASALFTSFGMQRVSLPSYYPSSQASQQNTTSTQGGPVIIKTDQKPEEFQTKTPDSNVVPELTESEVAELSNIKEEAR